ncbi:hypothetical protein [Paramicrobacterium chengjingii]|uniref:hypothetical protein n=1 Tax=Paramicrobacterium chengjingii TaxID=2769067 RepID=UPI00141E8857|nr:hypothetical protein [Microbacterium chengjingii]
MFVGHYGVAFAAKAIRPDLPLGGLFVATQAMDIVFSGLLLIGVERASIVPDGAGPAGVELVHVPYSHSLVAAVLIALAAALGVMFLHRNRRELGRSGLCKSAAVVAVVVLSHYLLDALVEDGTLPLFDATPRVGIGLPVLPILVVESLFVLAGAALYARATVPVDLIGRLGIPALAVALVAFNGYVAVAPSPTTVTLLAVSNVGAYAGIASVAWLLDRRRVPDVHWHGDTLRKAANFSRGGV